MFRRLIQLKSICILVVLLSSGNANAQFLNKDKKDKDKDKKSDQDEKNSIYSLVYENELSANFGAQQLLANHELVSRLENKFIPTDIFKKESKLSTAGNILFRIVKTGLMDYPLTYLTAITQRQIFGAQYRAEQLGASYTAPNLSVPQPYGKGMPSMATIYRDSLSPKERALSYIGGFEANQMISNLAAKNTLLNDHMLFEDGFLYLFSNNDLAFHIATGKAYLDSSFNRYADELNSTYGLGYVDIDKLKILSIADMILDPVNLSSAAGLFKYIAKGEEEAKLLWIKFGEKVKYLPSFDILTAPYGIEMLYKQYFKFDRSMLEFDFRHTAGSVVKSLGIDINMFNLLLGKDKRFSLDGLIGLWNQPEMSFRVDQVFEQFEGFGGMGNIIANYKILKRRNAFIQARLGYKSKGYYQGLSLNNNLLFNIGFAFR